jgi:hypothetical protein
MAQPAMKFRIGNLSATIWPNNNSGGKFFSTVLSRAYKGDNEEWTNTDQLNHPDLLNASALLQKCEMWISGQQ